MYNLYCYNITTDHSGCDARHNECDASLLQKYMYAKQVQSRPLLQSFLAAVIDSPAARIEYDMTR
jgi:hypothetical protein